MIANKPLAKGRWETPHLTPTRHRRGMPNTVRAPHNYGKSELSLRPFACKKRLTHRRTTHMRNPARCSGVYSNMLRIPLFLICSLAAVAQLRQQDPVEI